jgi:phage baseplate assembly protein V
MSRWVTWDELEARLRGIVRRAKPRSVDDTGAAQTAAVTVLNGEARTGVEILQPFGFASVPAPGSLMVVLAIGGDQGDLVGLPVASPDARMGKLEPGEAVIYGTAGQRVLCRADGSIEILSATKVYLSGKPFEVESASAVSIKAPKVRIEGTTWLMGDLHVAGSITAGGVITPGTAPPGGDPSAPSR